MAFALSPAGERPGEKAYAVLVVFGVNGPCGNAVRPFAGAAIKCVALVRFPIMGAVLAEKD
jgi:hypothetical protein